MRYKNCNKIVTFEIYDHIELSDCEIVNIAKYLSNVK